MRQIIRAVKSSARFMAFKRANMCPSSRFYMGLDVQLSPGCPYAVFDGKLNLRTAGWLNPGESVGIGAALASKVDRIEAELGGVVAIGIDCPRMPLDSLRRFAWKRRQGKWVELAADAGVYGRHSEVIIRTLKLANPQWTPIQGECPEWMLLGFELFRALKDKPNVFEVFPSASYAMLEKCSEPTFQINLFEFSRRPKDMLDACVAAITVREYLEGRGCEVGGGDKLGSIILPRPLPDNFPVALLSWPAS
jgi:hypothetical protein